MSKLLKALEKARHKKEQGQSNPVPENRSQEQDRIAQAFAKSSARAASGQATAEAVKEKPVQPVPKPCKEEVKPKYTQTQIVSPNERTLAANRIMTHIKDPRVRDAYDILRTQILQRSLPQGWNSLMVTSPHPGEGKTLTAINLALAIARHVQQTALVVGANFRNPKICTYFGLDECSAGLADYLMNGTQIQDLLFSPDMEKMVVLPTGKKLPNSDVLGSPNMRNLVQELKNKYPDRYVIYDSPHVLGMPDTLIFSSYVDAVLMVVEEGTTSHQDVEQAVHTLEDHGVNIIGTVLNSVRI